MIEDRIAEIILGLIIGTVVYLKIVGVITVSWLWLLSPLWIPFLIGCLLALAVGIVFALEIIKEKLEK